MGRRHSLRCGCNHARKGSLVSRPSFDLQLEESWEEACVLLKVRVLQGSIILSL